MKMTLGTVRTLVTVTTLGLAFCGGFLSGLGAAATAPAQGQSEHPQVIYVLPAVQPPALEEERAATMTAMEAIMVATSGR